MELLRNHSADPDSPLSGHSRTVNYLQNLGPNHIEIVLEFSLWVILSSPEDGLTIFTEDLDTVETLPRAQVLNWLLKQVNKRNAMSMPSADWATGIFRNVSEKIKGDSKELPFW